MPAVLNSKFTDNNLKLFFGNLLTHYHEIKSRQIVQDTNQIYNELYLSTQFILEHPNGSFYHLDRIEKNKVYEVFNILFKALPIYGKMSPQDKIDFKPILPQYRQDMFLKHDIKIYDCSNSTLYNWMLINSLMHRCYSHDSSVIMVPSTGSLGTVHSHRSEESKKESKNDLGQVIALLILISLAAAALVLTFVATYYLLNQFMNGFERIWYNEGWLKSVLLLASTITFGSVSTLFSLTIAATPLVALAVTAGINPVAVVAVGAISITLVGAGLACFVTDLIYGHIEKDKHKDSMDPEDPLRFRLTDSEEYNLLQNNIDPLVVKCAIVALRGEMSKVLESNQPIPSFFSRKFGNNDKVQLLLQQVRSLRNGTLTELEVGGLYFNCKKDIQYELPIPSAPILYPESFQQETSSFSYF